jgi:hypothetical protein
MWPFRRVPKPSPKRLIDLETEISEVKVVLAWLKKSFVDLNARVATITRQAKAGLVDAELGPESEKSGVDVHAPRATSYDRPAFPNSRRGY